MRLAVRGLPWWLVIPIWTITAAWGVWTWWRQRGTARADAAARAPWLADATGWAPQPFSLTVYERNIFGVRQVGGDVLFGASGGQMTTACSLPLLSGAVIAIALQLGAPVTVTAVLCVAGALASLFGLVGLRSCVRLSPAGVTVRSGVLPARTLAWSDIEDVRCRLEDARFQVNGLRLKVVVGVVVCTHRPPRRLPTCRAAALGATGRSAETELSPTRSKVDIVRRYRSCVVGPWPTDPLLVRPR